MSYTNQGLGTGRMTPMVKELLLITIGAFVLQYVFPIVLQLGALHSNWLSGFQVWRLVSYMFLHGGIFHLLMNMYGLFLFGPPLEKVLGKRQFLTLYFLSGILGGIGWSLLAGRYAVCVGASGAVFGLLGSYALLFPNDRLQLLFPPIVLKAWQFVLGFGLIELFHVLNQSGGRVANSAHLCGGIAGAIYTLVLIRKYEPWRFRRAFKWLDNLRDKAERHKAQADFAEKKQVDEILEKISKEGIGSLTNAERKVLKNAGRG
ncbi:rhomboid family intramembrane serine protease [Verrucomicrobiota bacterium]